MKTVLILVGVVLVLALLVWVGLRVPPRPFEPLEVSASGSTAGVALPDDLPDPVARFYRQLYGDELPRIDTAVISGRASLRIRGITLPARFRFFHDAGRAYRHHIEATFFGLPVLTVHETYLDGRARLELPFGVVENEPKVDESAHLGLWAEAVWFPSLWVSDPRVRWEPFDARTAVLVVPFGEEERRFVARFDPDTGMLRLLESMRFKDAGVERRTLWLNEARRWATVGDRTVAAEAALIWLDEGEPWAVFRVEEVAYGVEIEERLRGRGP